MISNFGLTSAAPGRQAFKRGISRDEASRGLGKHLATGFQREAAHAGSATDLHTTGGMCDHRSRTGRTGRHSHPGEQLALKVVSQDRSR